MQQISVLTNSELGSFACLPVCWWDLIDPLLANQPTMSITGLARVALGAPEWVAAWGGVGDYFKKKLEVNELDDPMAWAGLRGNRGRSCSC